MLLSTSIVHMLPEAREKIPKDAELMFCIGFLVVYLVDEIVHLFYGGDAHSVARSYGSGEETRLLRQEQHGVHGEGEMRERCCGDADNPRMCHVSHTEPCNKSASAIVGLLGALFVHSVLEGLAIGLQESTSQVLLLLAAVSCHKFVVGFCLGAELCASLPGRLCAHIVCITLFSGGSVIGIAVGAGLDSVNLFQDSPAVNIMQALAAGTLLYVTVSEVLPRERARWHERKRTAGIAQFVAVGLGFALMVLTTRYLDHDGA